MALEEREITKEEVLELLKTVSYPGFSRDIVSFGFVKDILIEDSKVTVNIEISTQDTTVKGKLENNIYSTFPKQTVPWLRFQLPAGQLHLRQVAQHISLTVYIVCFAEDCARNWLASKYSSLRSGLTQIGYPTASSTGRSVTESV